LLGDIDGFSRRVAGCNPAAAARQLFFHHAPLVIVNPKRFEHLLMVINIASKETE
jgi:hypothetical protein